MRVKLEVRKEVRHIRIDELLLWRISLHNRRIGHDIPKKLIASAIVSPVGEV